MTVSVVRYRMARITITYIGHASFRFESERGAVSYLDPWLDDNPTTDLTRGGVDRADVVLVTHGHGDHIGDSYEICKRTGAKFVGDYELCQVAAAAGVPETALRGLNPGGSVTVADVRITMTQAHHSHSLAAHVLPRPLPEGVLYHSAGATAGFVMAYDNGVTVYGAGDTCLFGDMQLIGQMYGPQVAILPVGGKYTMGVREGARAASLIRADVVIPCHYGPELGQPADIDELTRQVAILSPGAAVAPLQPGQSLVYTASSYQVRG